MSNKQRKCTNLYDRSGNLLYEGDRCKSWCFDELHIDHGYWLFEIIGFCNGDWYLFVENHEYQDDDDRPVLLRQYLDEVELCKGTDSEQMLIPIVSIESQIIIVIHNNLMENERPDLNFNVYFNSRSKKIQANDFQKNNLHKSIF